MLLFSSVLMKIPLVVMGRPDELGGDEEKYEEDPSRFCFAIENVGIAC